MTSTSPSGSPSQPAPRRGRRPGRRARSRGGGDPRPALRLNGPADLVVALPVLLGFRPVESLVLVSTGRRGRQRIGLTVRVDLPDPVHAAELAEQVAAHLRRDDRAETAALVVVAAPPGGTGPGPGPAGTEPPRADLVAAVAGALESHGVEVHTRVWVPAVEAGAPWRCYADCGCRGTLADPGSSPFAAEMVARGKPVYGDRSDLVRLVAATPEAARRTPCATPTGIDLFRAPPPAGEPAGAERDADLLAVDLHEQARAAACAGRLEFDERQLRQLAAALGRPRVRDTVLAAALTEAAITDAALADADLADAAGVGVAGVGAARGRGAPAGAEGDADSVVGPGYEVLWAALARELPDPDAADPAALLAAVALARGDGALANVALDRAEAARPDHRLAGLLREVALLGLPPRQVRAALLGWPGESP